MARRAKAPTAAIAAPDAAPEPSTPPQSTVPALVQSVAPVPLESLPVTPSRRFAVPRPHARPYRRRLDAFLEAYLGIAPNGTAFRAAQLAGWTGPVLLVHRRATRVLSRPAVQRELERRLRERLAAIRTPSIAEVMSELGHVGMRRGPDVDAAWWLTGAKVKSLELLAKHYGALTETIALRDLPRTPDDAAHVLALELQRIGISDGQTRYALPDSADTGPTAAEAAADTAGTQNDAPGCPRNDDRETVQIQTCPTRPPDAAIAGQSGPGVERGPERGRVPEPGPESEPEPGPAPVPRPNPSRRGKRQ